MVTSASADALAEKPGNVRLPDGSDLRWGLGFRLFRVGALRDPSLPGRTRLFQPEVRTLDTGLTLQAFYRPSGSPWRTQDARTLQPFQLISVAGFLELSVPSLRPAQSTISVGGGLAFFDDRLILGIGVDLYRGVPIRGADGMAGSDTASTGLLGWALVPSGELTIENVFFVINFNFLESPSSNSSAR